MRAAIAILIFFILFASLSIPITRVKADSNSITLWVCADMQGAPTWSWSDWSDATNDVSSMSFDAVLSLGDLIGMAGSSNNGGNASQYFDQYLNYFAQTGHNRSELYNLLGNHDWSGASFGGPHYHAWEKLDDINVSNRPFSILDGVTNETNWNYTFQIGNVLFIMLSDDNATADESGMRAHSQGIISDAVFNWWENLVINNQDKIIITCSHQPLEGTNILSDDTPRDYIKDSSRFLDVMENYTVDFWLNGHEHNDPWDVDSNGWSLVRKIGNTTFINVAAILKRGNVGTSYSSRFFTFTNGSNILQMKVYDHYGNKWLWNGTNAYPDSHCLPYQTNFTMSKPFVLAGSSSSSYSTIDSASFTMQATVNESPSPSLTLLDSKTFTMSAVVRNESHNGSGFIITHPNTPYYVLAGMLVFFPFLAIVYKKWR